MWRGVIPGTRSTRESTIRPGRATEIDAFARTTQVITGNPNEPTGFGGVALFSMASGRPRRPPIEEPASEIQPI
jgi:hypothetical protein